MNTTEHKIENNEMEVVRADAVRAENNFKIYDLQNQTEQKGGYIKNALRSLKEFSFYIAEDKKLIPWAFILILLNSVAGILTPYIIAKSIDQYISHKDLTGLSSNIFILIGIFLITAIIGYVQSKMMGGISQRTLYRLRGSIFEKLQSLPIAFFNQNKSGDLMSRINNDTDKLNQFLSETLVRFTGTFFVIFGIGIFIFFLNWKLALVLLASTAFLLILTRILSPFVERQNKKSSAATGLLSSGIQESLTNFKVIIAFNRRNYFEESLCASNEKNYKASIKAGLANHIFEPFYDMAGNISQLVVLIMGIALISQGQLTIGLLIGFLGYAQRFYDPLRILATIMGNIQVSLASWSRVRNILNLNSHLTVIESETGAVVAGESRMGDRANTHLLEFKNVSFGYDKNQHVLSNIDFHLEKGKTYALIGPTGGGKSTIAGLMVRLHDPVSGQVLFRGRDLRSYESAELGKRIGVILQDPFLFSGTVGENIRYGNDHLNDMKKVSDEDLRIMMKEKGLVHLLDKFEDGLASKVNDTSENISLGQKQLISFIRILLREPELLIMDEATANIDTVTEQLLSDIIAKLPQETTKVVIAHRLNTIRDADEILFVNGGKAERAADFEDALKKIHGSKRTG